LGLSVGLSPDGGRVNPPEGGFALIEGGEGGFKGASDGEGTTGSSSLLSESRVSSDAGVGGGRLGAGRGAGSKEGPSSSPKDGREGGVASSEGAVSSSVESKGAGVNLGRGGNNPSLSSDSSGSSDIGIGGVRLGAGAMSRGAGGGKDCSSSSSSPKDGRAGGAFSSVLSLSSSVESTGAGVNWGRGGKISELSTDS
jgi:hypothetical protein